MIRLTKKLKRQQNCEKRSDESKIAIGKRKKGSLGIQLALCKLEKRKVESQGSELGKHKVYLNLFKLCRIYI